MTVPCPTCCSFRSFRYAAGLHAYDGKSQPGSACFLGMALVNPVEPFKHPFLMLGWNSDAGVLHSDNCLVFVPRHGNLHKTTLVIILDRVVAKVIDDFAKESADPVQTDRGAGSNLYFLSVAASCSNQAFLGDLVEITFSMGVRHPRKPTGG